MKERIMTILKHLSIAFTGVVILFALSSPAHARFKCWTNSEGIKECGEKVPPEYAQQGHQEMSKQGMVLENKKRAKTKAELEEQAKQAELLAIEQKAKDLQDKQDKILLNTFTSIRDIETVRDDKLAVIESSISLTKKRNEKTQEDLDKRIHAAASEERAGKAPNKALLKDIDLLRARLSKRKSFINDKGKEKDQVNAGSALDIERFKRLKGL
jgi:hypothetical protein